MAHFLPLLLYYGYRPLLILYFSKPCFVLDPIDGTSNYVHNLNLSAIALAYIEDNEVVAGVVYNPFNNELFYGVKGGGAYFNGKRISVSTKTELKDAFITFGTTPYDKSKAPIVMENVLNVFKECLEVRRLGSAALDVCYVACGRFDAYFEMDIKLWDYAAASVIAKEAGAVFVDYEGNDISFGYSTNVVCANEAIAKQLTPMLKST